MEKVRNKLSTLNSQLSTPQGFTLIELLSALSVFIVIGTMIVVILFISLQGSRKSEVQAVLRQNGDFALSQMVRNIRYAKSLDDPVSCVTPVTQSSVTITSLLDGGQTVYSCLLGSTSDIASNSASLVNTGVVQVSSCSFTCSQQSVNAPPTITIQFILQSASGNNLIENTGSIPFQSSVSMRNYATYSY